MQLRQAGGRSLPKVREGQRRIAGPDHRRRAAVHHAGTRAHSCSLRDYGCSFMPVGMRHVALLMELRNLV